MNHSPIEEPITIDIETIPTQDQALADRLGADIRAAAKAAMSEVGPPGNWKDEAKIATWWEEIGNAKKSELFFKGEEAAEEAVRKTSLDAAFGNVAVVCIKVGNDKPISLFDGGFSFREPGYEAWLLNETNKALTSICGHHRGQRLLGHNLNFDRTFLRQRGIVRGVAMHSLITAMHRPWDDATIDTMTLWTGDYRDRVKLEKLCDIFDLQHKGDEIGEEIDGSRVWEFVQRGDIDKVAAYCAGDVERTWQAYLRLTLQVDVPQAPYLTLAQREALAANDANKQERAAA